MQPIHMCIDIHMHVWFPQAIRKASHDKQAKISIDQGTGL
jgi:hypothetical protein